MLKILEIAVKFYYLWSKQISWVYYNNIDTVKS